MEHIPTHCPVCGVYYIEGTFRFSHLPKKPVSSDEVASLVCVHLHNKPERNHLIPSCINKSGKIFPDAWDDRLNSSPVIDI
jgi:hypothetical protein